jgi:hypothetical protein
MVYDQYMVINYIINIDGNNNDCASLLYHADCEIVIV